MTAKEICRKYDESVDKVEMIQVLADFEECTKQDIIELLENNGRTVPLRKKRGTKKESTKMVNNNSIPDVIIEALEEKMDKIDQRIKELEPYVKEFMELEKQYKEIAQYLCS